MQDPAQAHILTPDQRLRVFVSSTIQELSAEREAVREAIESLHLVPVMFETGARPYPAREVYAGYLEQSHVFVGIYGARYGTIVRDGSVARIEDEYELSSGKPRLLYVKSDAEERDPRLSALLERFKDGSGVSYTYFTDLDELARLVKNDLVVLLTEHFLDSGGDRSRPARGAQPAYVPQPLAPLIGRERELREIEKLLGEMRLVTLTGPGGTGKTRLALEILGRLEDPDLEGPWVVELAGLQEPDLVPTVVAQTVGLISQPGRATADVLAEVIGERTVLLVLDNCEHVVVAVSGLVSELLTMCPNLKVLATSREPLKVRAEVVYPLEPLPVTMEGPGDLLDGDAMRMFEARAADIVPGFKLDDSNRDAVRTICAALDGLPLAIELVVSRLRLLSPQNLAERLDDRFALLAHGPRDLPNRQRTLMATIDWSYDLLSDGEKRFFARLSVFRGGFELDAIERVTRVSDLELLDLLEELVSKSLVAVDRVGSELRYDLLETLREYGRRQLDPSESLELQRLHLEWAQELVISAESRLRGPEAGRWIERLDRERDNLRSALTFSMEQGLHQTTLAMAGGLHWFWYRRGYVSEARLWLERALAAAPDEPTKERAQTLLGIAAISYLGGELPDAGRYSTEAVAAAEAADDTATRVRALLYAAYFQGMLGQLTDAEKLVRRGADLARGAKLRDSESEAFSALGLLARIQGRPEEAEELFLTGASIAKEIGHRWHEGSSYWLAAKVALDRGDAGTAETRIRDALRLIVSEDDRTSTLVGLHTMAAALAGTGSPEDGAMLIGAVAASGEKIGFFPERMDPLDGAMTIDRVRASLGESAYADAYERGRGLTVRDALEIAGIEHSQTKNLSAWAD